MSKTYIGAISALDKSALEVPHVEPAKPTAAETDRALKIMYDNAEHVPDPPPPAPGELHSPAHLHATLLRRLPELWAEAGIGAAEQTTLRTNIERMHQETGLPEVLSTTIAEGVIDSKIADAKSTTPEADKDALDARILADTAASRTAMRDKYGAHAEQLLERTIAFVKSKAGLNAALAYNGMGSRPDLVLALAAHVHSNAIR